MFRGHRGGGSILIVRQGRLREMWHSRLFCIFDDRSHGVESSRYVLRRFTRRYRRSLRALLLQLPYQRLELLNALSDSTCTLSLRTRGVGAGEGNSLAHAGFAGKLTIASYSVDVESVSIGLFYKGDGKMRLEPTKGHHGRFTCDPCRKYMTTAVFLVGDLVDGSILLRCRDVSASHQWKQMPGRRLTAGPLTYLAPCGVLTRLELESQVR